jgi:hypothetical protein
VTAKHKPLNCATIVAAAISMMDALAIEKLYNEKRNLITTLHQSSCHNGAERFTAMSMYMQYALAV